MENSDHKSACFSHVLFLIYNYLIALSHYVHPLSQVFIGYPSFVHPLSIAYPFSAAGAADDTAGPGDHTRGIRGCLGGAKEMVGLG